MSKAKKPKLNRSQKLLRAAPELLEACKQARWWIAFGDTTGGDLQGWAELADQLMGAIRKADPSYHVEEGGWFDDRDIKAL